MSKKITRGLVTILSAMTIAGVLLTGNAVAQPSAPALVTGHRVQINKIYYNSPGPDNGSNSSLNHEWVRLYNGSSSNIHLTNWTLRDRAGHVFTFPTFTLDAHSYVKIRTGRGTDTATNLYWGRRSYIWNNTGDRAKLEDSNGGKVDSCSYTGTSLGYVYC